jgi:hypothetical protein
MHQLFGWAVTLYKDIKTATRRKYTLQQFCSKLYGKLMSRRDKSFIHDQDKLSIILSKIETLEGKMKRLNEQINAMKNEPNQDVSAQQDQPQLDQSPCENNDQKLGVNDPQENSKEDWRSEEDSYQNEPQELDVVKVE